jgi:hypothetical protein
MVKSNVIYYTKVIHATCRVTKRVVLHFGAVRDVRAFKSFFCVRQKPIKQYYNPKYSLYLFQSNERTEVKKLLKVFFCGLHHIEQNLDIFKSVKLLQKVEMTLFD